MWLELLLPELPVPGELLLLEEAMPPELLPQLEGLLLGLLLERPLALPQEVLLLAEQVQARRLRYPGRFCQQRLPRQ